MTKKHSALLLTVIIVIAIVIVVNWFLAGARVANYRLDLTEKKIYTLSDGTRRILGNIKSDEPVSIRFYATGDNHVMRPDCAKYASTVEDMLLEIEKTADGKVTLQRIDPRPDSDSEDKAIADDIAGQQMDQMGNKMYFGLAVECGDRKEVLPFLDPGAETSLEYDIARAVAKVNNPKKPVIGVMSAMPIAGPAMNFPGMRQGPPPWEVIKALRSDYEVREVAVTADKIDTDITVLLLIHPADIRPKTEFAIDQFVLRGGKVMAFVDPKSIVSNMYNQQQQNPMMGMMPPTVPAFSTLEHLFKAWGVGFDSQMCVADMSDATRNLPTYLTIGPKDGGINTSVPVTSQLEIIQMFTAGAFTVDKKDGVKSLTLLQSSENTMMIDGTTAEKAQRGPLDNFHSDGRKRILGLELTGHFKTAFPDGPPKDESPSGPNLPGGMGPGMLPPGAMPPTHGTGGSDKDAGAPETKDAKDKTPAAPVTAVTPPVSATTAPVSADSSKAKPAEPKPAATKPATPPAAAAPKTDASPSAPPVSAAQSTPVAAPKPEEKKPAGPASLKESTNEDAAVFLFSDSDMLYDRVAFGQDQLGRMMPINHNLALLLNTVEMLSGGSDLIAVRSRGSTRRAFTKFQEMSANVVAKYKPQIQQLLQKKEDAEKEAQKIRSVELKMDANGKIDIANPETRAKLAALNETQVSLNKELREIRKQENRDRDHLETWITALNLALIPVLIILFGITLAVKRHTLQAAK
jgi:ABC-type uncharacterized transport system involved in gliding motility auxiliary subunit